MSIVADQRKNATQQRTNASSKKNNNKQNQPPSQVAAQSQKAGIATVASSPASTDLPKPKSPPPSSKQQQQAQAKEHVPLKGFNSEDIDVLLSQSIDPQAEIYKSEQPQSQKSGPWGQKARTMATGKDFWLELRRQVAVLQRGESTNKGG